MKDSPGPPGRRKKAFAAAGCKINTFHLLMGQYDAAVMVEAPNDTTITRVTLALASQGSVHTETMRAFTEDEFRKIISSLP